MKISNWCCGYVMTSLCMCLFGTFREITIAQCGSKLDRTVFPLVNQSINHLLFVSSFNPRLHLCGKLLHGNGYASGANQSINQSNIYSANIPGVARLSGATSKSVLNSKIDEAVPQRQQVIGHVGVYEGKARSKRYIFRQFLKMETEVDERTNSGKLFQREGAQELNYLFPALVLTLGTDKVIPLFDLSEHDGSGVASKECRLTGCFSLRVCRSANRS